ncbi:MAG: hypothetical protein EXS68_00595 [Candidatus Ryanbacteria bacterium]|nr:hypothetical protein [Candidatus Ryanbacteria bacterium]
MKTKKASASWYIAATHYLTAGFVVPLIVSLVYSFMIFPKIGSIDSTVLWVVELVISILAIVLGVIYSARYLQKTYIIQEKDKIVLLSSIYFFLVTGAFVAMGSFTRSFFGVSSLWNIADYIFRLAAFYLVSKKFVTNTEEAVVSTQSSTPAV